MVILPKVYIVLTKGGIVNVRVYNVNSVSHREPFKTLPDPRRGCRKNNSRTKEVREYKEPKSQWGTPT